MPVTAIAGASVLNAGVGIIAGNKAAKAQKKAGDQVIAEQRRQYDQTRADQAPWRDTGVRAVDRLASLYGVQREGATVPTAADGTPLAYGGFETTPGYQWRKDEGLKAINRQASARGLLASGGAVKAQQRYGDGLASSEFENFANRLASIAGVGQTATQATNAAGQAAANNISNAYTQQGNARASAYQNVGNQIGGALSSIAGAFGTNAGGGFSTPDFLKNQTKAGF